MSYAVGKLRLAKSQLERVQMAWDVTEIETFVEAVQALIGT